MHELGVVIEVVRQVQEVARKNHVTKIDKLVLQIGELSSMIPHYVEECYPAAVDGTMLEETTLSIEIIPGNARCYNCEEVFNILKNKSLCPHCQSKEWELLSGKEFMIKEIVAC